MSAFVDCFSEPPEDDFYPEPVSYSEPEFLAGPGPAPIEVSPLATGPKFFTAEEWDADIAPRVPELCPVLNGKPLFYEGDSHLLVGKGGDGKSMFLAARAADILGDGGTVLWLDYESDRLVIQQRLKGLGVTAAEAGRMAYWRVDGPLGAKLPSVADSVLADFLLKYQPTFTVLDSVARAMNTAGASESSNDEVGEWWQRLVRRQFEMRELTFVGIHHPGHTVPGTQARGRGASSFEHQLTGGAFALEVVEAFSQETSGRLKLVVAKDRHGARKKGEVAAIVDVKVEDCLVRSMDMFLAEDGTVPTSSASFRPTKMMSALCTLIGRTPGLTTRVAVYDAIEGKRQTKVDALRLLEAEGNVRQSPEGWVVVEPYRQYADRKAPASGGLDFEEF